MSKNKNPKDTNTPINVPNFELSISTLQVAHQCIGRVPAGNAQQAVALANSLYEIEKALERYGQAPITSVSEGENPPTN